MRGASLPVLFVLLLAACAEDAPDGPAQERVGGYLRSQFLFERDRFPSVSDPRTVDALAADWLRDDDEVFGVVAGEAARAYPIPMLAWHHVVNDVIAGIPVAVTY